jgi:hypothetical protein
MSENQKWIAFYDARYAAEKATWNAPRLTERSWVRSRVLP